MNFGFYEIYNYLNRIENVNKAIYNPDMIIAIKNPLLICFGIASVPYMILGSLLNFLY